MRVEWRGRSCWKCQEGVKSVVASANRGGARISDEAANLGACFSF